MMKAIPDGFKLISSEGIMKDGRAIFGVTYENEKGERRYYSRVLFEEGDPPNFLVQNLSSFAWNMGKYMVEHELWEIEDEKLRAEIAERNKSIPKDLFLNIGKKRR